MPTIREEMAADLANAVLLYGQSFEWGGDTYPCVRRDEPTMSELQEYGGFIEGVDYYLVVAKSLFPGAVFPADGDLVNAGTHQVKKVKGQKDPLAAQLVIHVGSADT